MTITLYYFSGTGNSLEIANALATRIKNCDLKPIASIINNDYIVDKSEKIGFVSPLYAFGLPELMTKFIEKIDLPNAKYIFGIITRGADSWGGLEQLEILLRKKSKHLTAGFYIDMPTNYILRYTALSEKEQKQIFKNAELKIEEIIKIVGNNESKIETSNIFFRFFARIYHMIWVKFVNSSDKRFFADENCTSCGLCEKVCPVNNITLEKGKPSWHHKCQQCLACINFCPEEAIQYGTKTVGKKRYHHPSISIYDISKQKININI